MKNIKTFESYSDLLRNTSSNWKRSDFDIVFDKDFQIYNKKNRRKIGFRMRRHPSDFDNRSSWQPLFLTITNNGIDWSDDYNSEHFFNYYENEDPWDNEFYIENYGGYKECQLQLEYQDGTFSEIYDTFDNETKIPIENKKVKNLVICKPSKRQIDYITNEEKYAIEPNKIIVGRKYNMITKFKKDENDNDNINYENDNFEHFQTIVTINNKEKSKIKDNRIISFDEIDGDSDLSLELRYNGIYNDIASEARIYFTNIIKE